MFIHPIAVLAVFSLMTALPTHAADHRVRMDVPPPVSKNVAAMPLIADPSDDAERRINTALQRLTDQIRKAVPTRNDDQGKQGPWERTVEVPMRGPGFISFVIRDEAFCGGAHPAAATMAIVYDLRTGRPVDWTTIPFGALGDGPPCIRFHGVKITLGQMRSAGARGVLIYCSDHKCSHQRQ